MIESHNELKEATKDNTPMPFHHNRISGKPVVCKGIRHIPVYYEEDGNQDVRRCVNYDECHTKATWKRGAIIGGRWSIVK